MAPSAVTEANVSQKWVASFPAKGKETPATSGEGCASNTVQEEIVKRPNFLLDRNLHKEYPTVVGGKGNYLFTSDGRRIFDATCGIAVACLGYGNERVIEAMHTQLQTGVAYLASMMWANKVVDELCQELIKGTDGKMSRVYLTGSGSEAMDATIKLSRQFFYENDKQSKRVNFIAREQSYHGNTIGALSISGHVGRRAPYLSFLMDTVHHIPACNAYRQRLENETDASFVVRKAAELEYKFQELGPETVIGFVCEPVVGAALGCVSSVPGYLTAMREVCHRHGALFILDEVMCGMGRTGTLHAWQQEDAVPDIQTIAKGLGGGYQAVAAMMVSEKVMKVLLDGTGLFVHGQTYQAMPIQAAAALEVQRIIREENLMENVMKQGAYLEMSLKEALGNHPNVGDIRGRGLFWGLEFVKDKATKEPFDPELQIAQKIHDLAISSKFNMTTYPGTGTADGKSGDHVLVAPAYNITKEEIDHIVGTLTKVINQLFETIENL